MPPQSGSKISDLKHYLPYVLLIIVFIAGVWLILTLGAQLNTRPQPNITSAGSISTLTSGLKENFRNPLSVLLLQIIVIIIMAALFGRLFRRLVQPPVMGGGGCGLGRGRSVLGVCSARA